jgi:hypothetical protein
LLVKRECVWSNGARLGGDFMCSLRVVRWLADQLDLAADEKIAKVVHDDPPDHLVVFAGGGDRGVPISISVLNRREPSAPHGKTFGLPVMDPAVAHRLALDLRKHLGIR